MLTFLILLFKLLTQYPFHLFSLYPYPLSSLFSLSDMTSSFIAFCYSNGRYYCILFHTMTYFFNNAILKLVKTKFCCLNSNLSYPEDLKKQWLLRRVGSSKCYKRGGGGSLRPSFLSNCRFVSSLFSIILSLLPFLILSLLPFLISLPFLHDLLINSLSS